MFGPCEYCGAKFKTERGFGNHSCARMKMAKGSGKAGIMRGFSLFDKWYRMNGFSKKSKDLDAFMKSPHFSIFMDLSEFVSEFRVPSGKDYVEWIVRNRVPSRDWRKDSSVVQFRKDYEKGSLARDATVRSLEMLSTWCDERGIDLEYIFDEISPGECLAITRSGIMSPWIILGSNSAELLLSRFTEDQAEELDRIIDIDYWNSRMDQDPATDEIRSMVEEIGL